MADILTILKETPITTILVISGIMFLLLAFADHLGSHISISSNHRNLSAITGVFLLISGIYLSIYNPNHSSIINTSITPVIPTIGYTDSGTPDTSLIIGKWIADKRGIWYISHSEDNELIFETVKRGPFLGTLTMNKSITVNFLDDPGCCTGQLVEINNRIVINWSNGSQWIKE